VARVAYRFVPCAEDGRPRNGSQYTSIRDTSENIRVGSVLEASLLGYTRWEVIEMRADSGGLLDATGADGMDIPLGGTLVCRGVE